jgi:CDP-6-deoxy-D-xylo-4-hexulose-3-dehydrase
MRISLNTNSFTDLEKSAAMNVLESGWMTQGRRVEQFEYDIANFVGTRYAVMVNSGSSANFLLWQAMKELVGVWNKGEVIVPAVGWSTTYWPIIQAGFKPVLIDVDPTTFQVDTKKLEAAITRNTRAINLVHVLGNMANMDEIQAIAASREIGLIEDACEAFGTHRLDGRKAGSFGNAGTFSFYFSHQLSTIEGGMIVTNSGILADLLRMMRAHGWSRDSVDRGNYELRYSHRGLDPSFLFVTEGFNLRSTDLNAAIGRVQLNRFRELNSIRRSIRAYWLQSLDKTNMKPMLPVSGTTISPFGFPVMCGSKDTRNRLKKYLTEAGIETRAIVSGNIARQPAFDKVFGSYGDSLPGADAITDRGLMWGLHSNLTLDEIRYVGDTIERFEE